MRDYAKERNWRINKYDEIRASIPKELGTELRQKLKSEKITIANWVKAEAEKYVKKS